MLSSLPDRGLLLSMLAYAWNNGAQIPKHAGQLARVLSLSVDEVERAPRDLVNLHFRDVPDDPTRLYCPELLRQLQRMAEIRSKQAAAGRQTARTRRQATAYVEKIGRRSPLRLAGRSADRSVHAPELRGTEGTESLPGDNTKLHEEWLAAYDGSPGERRQ